MIVFQRVRAHEIDDLVASVRSVCGPVGEISVGPPGVDSTVRVAFRRPPGEPPPTPIDHPDAPWSDAPGPGPDSP